MVSHAATARVNRLSHMVITRSRPGMNKSIIRITQAITPTQISGMAREKSGIMGIGILNTQYNGLPASAGSYHIQHALQRGLDCGGTDGLIYRDMAGRRGI